MSSKPRLRASVPHHAGELLQGPIFHGGRLAVGLMTLIVAHLQTTAAWIPSHAGGIRVVPATKHKAQAAASLFAAFMTRTLGVSIHGQIVIENPSLPIGRGYGTSSCDVLATLKLIAMTIGVSGSDVNELLLAFGRTAEGAIDPLLLDAQDILFNPREGIIIKRYAGNVPLLRCIGGDLGFAVDTNLLSERQRTEGFSRRHVAEFAIVEAMIDRALRDHDLNLVIRAATLSAVLNQEQIALPGFEKLMEIAESVGAGLSISHSGSAFNMLLDPLDGDLAAKESEVTAGLQSLGVKRVLSFTNYCKDGR